MNHADEILRMIETCDASDVAKMDEIDARVYCWRARQKFIKFNINGTADCEMGMLCGPFPKVSSSRDALKAIRPEGWKVRGCDEHSDGWYFRLVKGPEVKSGEQLPTEELAELHAIIQAITFERKQKAGGG